MATASIYGEAERRTLLAHGLQHRRKAQTASLHAIVVLGSLQREVFPTLGANLIHEGAAPVILKIIQRIEKHNALHVA